MDKVSVITVVYNRKDDLKKTIKSVIAQDYLNIEFIIIDGGSTDGSLDVIKEYEDKISIWITEPDKGIYDAMNKGTQLATGKWVNYLNTGDVFSSSTTISEVFNNKNFDNFDFVYGSAVYIYEDYNIERPSQPVTEFWIRQPFVHQAVFAKTELSKANPYDLNLGICADYNFTYGQYKKGASFKQLRTTIVHNDFRLGATKDNYFKTYRESMKVRWKYSTWDKILLMELNSLRMILVRGILPKSIVKWIRTSRFKSVKE